MKKKDFFEKQSALTAAKTQIYKHYIEGYLPKLLMTYGTCLIADLFCGAGKNGEKNGSPLILINKLNYILSSPQLQKKTDLKVYVLFNDIDESNIKNLRKEIKSIKYDEKVIHIIIKNKEYEVILKELTRKPEKLEIPKFFFLDPFKYSRVKMGDLKKLMSLSNAEILLFIPIFHSYRFSKKEFNDTHKTRIFIEEYTTKGVADYKNIHNFVLSVREKFLQEISIPYVRPILLDGGSQKNALFLLTKHQKAMLLMNKVAFKLTDEGSRVKVKKQSLDMLFQINEVSSFYSKFRQNLEDALRKSDMTNSELIEFTIQNCFLPKHVKKELTELYKLGKIKITDSDNIEISDIRKWNIADKITKKVIFKWIKS
jgi:three-Cys-motif partner protein